MWFIIDTNLLLSAIIKPESFPAKALETITACRDPKDNKFLELAVAANADCIVTGDKDLLILHPFRGIPVITASEFLSYTF